MSVGQMVKNKIKQGYKQTEVGIIPEDWKILSLDKCVKEEITYGIVQAGPHIENGVPYIRTSDMSGDILSVNGMLRTTRKIASKFKRSEVRASEIVFAIRATVGKVLEVPKELDGANLTQGTARISPTANFSNRYVLYALQTNYFKKQLNMEIKGTTFNEITLASLRKLKIAKPELIEQQKIVQALMDIYHLIEMLKKIITKKKFIKKGAMQELLTGKRRLEGFKEKWSIERLGNLLDYEQPTKYLVTDTNYDSNYSTPVLTAGKTFVLGFTNEKTGIFQNLPVIIFDDFTTVSRYVVFPFKAKSSAMKMLKPKNEDVNLKFIYERMQLINFSQTDHKRYWLSEYQNLEIEVPKHDEQNAIAQILSDMDSEIEEMETNRDKYIMIKNGMMQKLLTGEIRLK